jgi:fatty-acyl-CoA synthase
MDGLMQDFPLTLPHLHMRAERLFADKQLVTVSATGKTSETYGEWADRTRRIGGALDTLGISDTGRVATFGWNTARHAELYFAAPCTGRVLHALNIRLFPEQLVYVANHAEDEVVFIDRSLAARAWPLFDQFRTARHIVVMDDGTGDIPEAPAGKTVHDYEELLAASAPVAFRVTDENRAASMCYTSGTTGNPKGVVYSHRSTFLHTYGVLTSGGLGPVEEDRVLPVVPMFHANAWGLVHAAIACGADLIMPGPDLSPSGLAALIESERVTLAAGVPTIWMGVLPELKGRDTSSLRAIPCGGSAVPRVLSEAYREQVGLPITQAWGMTETSPVASSGHIKTTLAAVLDDDGKADLRTTVGQPLFGVEARIVAPGSLEPLPWDGESSGELQVTGPVGGVVVLQRRALARVVHRRRLAQDRRRRQHRRARLHPAARPHQGRDQVRRRVDQLGRARERDHGPPGGRRGRGHRASARPLGRAPAGLRGHARGRDGHQGGHRRLPRRPGGQVVAPRRRRLRGRDPQDQRGQVLEEGPAHAVRGLPLHDRRRLTGRRNRCRARMAQPPGMSDAELLILRDTDASALVALDEDELLDLHTRVRRARNKHVGQYRRQAGARVEAAQARGAAYTRGQRARDRAEVFETALARVSTALARAARRSAAELRADRIAAARADGTGPARAGRAADSSPTPEAAARPAKSGARKKREASSLAQGARRQAKRDAQG